MTDKDVFRTCFDLLVQIRQAGDDPTAWRRINTSTKMLIEQHIDDEFLIDMLRATYNEGYRSYYNTYQKDIYLSAKTKAAAS